MTAQLEVFYLIDLTHATGADAFEDLVVADRAPDHAGPILPRCGLLLGTTDPLNDPIVARTGR